MRRHPVDALFECSSCKGTFREDGLHLDVHGQALVHVCPECLSGVRTFQLQLHRDRPGDRFAYHNFLALDEFAASS